MTTKKDYLKRSIAYLVRRVYKSDQTKHHTLPNLTAKAGPTLEGLGPFLPSLACSSPGCKLFSAHRTLDTIKVNAAHFCRRNRLSAFRAYGIERRPHFF
jgi:hypothetical protein